MKTKKNFSFDEQKNAEKILKEGFPNKTIDYSQIYLIAKYYRQVYKYGKIRLEKELIRFCKEHDPNFNPVIETESIKKWIKSAMNYNLRKIESVSISPNEIEFLKAIENERDRRLLFVTLILSKALKMRNTKKIKGELKTSNNYYIRYNNFLDIIKLAKIKNFGEIDFADMLYKYKDYFTFYSAEQELIRLEFVDKNPEFEIIIDNLDRLMDYYELFFGKKKAIAFCINCGKEYIKTNPKQKYCKECAIEIDRAKARIRMRKK